jgi:HAUS augmin-like complex subunit 1
METWHTNTVPLELGLFSPSKALQQERLAKDWSYVHQFLARKYPAPLKVPKFEQNEDTLQALLGLAAANEKADDEWDLVCRVERDALRDLEHEETTTTIHSSLQNALTQSGQSSLLVHSTAATLLNTTTTNPTELAHTLITLITTHHTLSQQLSQLSHLQAALTRHESYLTSQLDHLNSPSFSTGSTDKSLPQRTTETLRQTKLLKAKIAEYDERLRQNASAAATTIPEALLVQVETASANLEVLIQKVESVEGRISAFEGVPPEAREVRRLMEELRGELAMWVRRRDELFEAMVATRRGA